MPGKHLAPSDNPIERSKTTTKSARYTSGAQIQSALRTENPDGLLQALTSIRNQLAPKTQEVSVTPQDERLVIAKQWMVLSPGPQDLFNVWDEAHPRQPSTLALVMSTLSGVLTLLSAHSTDHSLGHPIMKTLLQPVRLRCMNSYIGGSHNELIITTLKLYNVMSSFAGGRDKGSVMEGFGWDIKSLPKLLNMRRRMPRAAFQPDPLLRPDIRTLFIFFLLSFVDADATTQLKNMFLEQRRDIFLSTFKGIPHDHYSVARRILEACWTGIWSDNKVKRTLKISLFSETTIGNLIKLYDRVQSTDDDVDHVPADLVHHFLLAISTRPGSGICFKDRGWYQRDTDPDDVALKEDDTIRRTGRIYNKILAKVLKSLKVNEDPRQQELAIKILGVCPELVAGYWSAVALTLEPRLSTKWITNIAFFGNVISLPIPTPTFYLSNQLYNPTPPPVSTILENVLPSVNTKKNMSRGLQSSSSLVQHCTALALSKCLVKFQHVIEKFREIALALGEDDDGQWSIRCLEVETEVRKRVPDFMVVVAFGQQAQQAPTKSPAHINNQNNKALLAESAQRLLWLYQHCLPAVVSEARFDVGKLLQTFSSTSQEGETDDEHEPDTARRLHRVQQLHVLNILGGSDQFSWAAKSGSLQTPLFILFKAFAVSTLPAIKKALGHLICHILARSILFQEDTQEADLWLKALPEHRPTVSTDFPATMGVIDMQDECECVITFLDECVQKCLRTPYKYVEALSSLADASALYSSIGIDYSSRLDERPSPLLMTLLEHLQSRINNKSLPAEHIIALTAFIGRLVFCLLGKGDLSLLTAFVDKVEHVLMQNTILEESQDRKEIIDTALRRELKIMRRGLASSIASEVEMAGEGTQDWLAASEALSIPKTKTARKHFALRIIDNLRTMQSPLSVDQLKRLFTIVLAFDISVFPRVIEFLVPGQADLWQAMELAPDFSVFRPHLTFERLYLHTRPEQLFDEDKQKVLVENIYMHKPTVLDLKRVLCYIVHRITASRENHDSLKAHMILLARISEMGRLALCTGGFKALRELIFVHSTALRDLFLSALPMNVFKAIQDLLEACFDHSLPSDRQMLSPLSNHWYDLLKSGNYSSVQDSAMTASLWIKYLEPSQLLDLLDSFTDFQPPRGQEPANVVLDTLASLASEWPNEVEYVRRLPRLLSMRCAWNSSLLDRVIASIVESSLPIYLEGLPLPSIQGNFSSLIARSSSRWTGHFSSIKAWNGADVEQFHSEDISESSIRIVTGLLYQQPSARLAVLRWISKGTDVARCLPMVHALLDVLSSTGNNTLESEDDHWTSFLPQLAAITADQDAPPLSRSWSQSCIVNILHASKAKKSSFLRILATEFKSWLKKKPTREVLVLAIWLGRRFGSDANQVVSAVLDTGLRSSVDCMTDEAGEVYLDEFLQLLASLVASTSQGKPHLVETVLSVVIRHRLSHPAALQLAICSVSSCHLKPVVVNHHLQSIIQHQHFFKLCSRQSSSEVRELLIELLSRLFNLHPNNTCQITHIDPLIKVYRGTLNNGDLKILSILQLFEKQRKLSVAPLLSSWSTTPNSASITALEALQSLDPTIVFLTCTNFPQWRRIQDSTIARANTTDSKLYDPVFLLLLFNQMMAEQLPSTSIAWLELLRTNVVSLFLRSLSARDGKIRELALCQIVSLWQCLENTDFQEKSQVQYILGFLKQLMPDPSSSFEYPRRLPTYTSLLLCHALRTAFYPTSSLYPLISRFLLQRPALDISDVPMLYSMLYNSDDDWKKERTWIIKFLADGMAGSEDWKVLKRRHTWDLLASLFQSESDIGSVGLRAGILEVLANLTCNAQATASLILKSGLLSWIEMQLLHGVSIDERGVEWLKILENILLIANPGKIEAATNGDWRRIICRCLCHLLDGRLPNNLAHAVPAILRLASLGGNDQFDFSPLLTLAFKNLEKLEAQIQTIASNTQMLEKIQSKYTLLTPPHHSMTLRQRIAFETVLEPEQKLALWGKLLEMLLQSCMFLNRKPPVWDALIPRILVWRSLRGDTGDEGDISEWVRREVIVNLQRAV